MLNSSPSFFYFSIETISNMAPQDERTLGVNLISISLDVRKVQKSSFFSANVNVDDEHLKQIKKINTPLHLLVVLFD